MAEASLPQFRFSLQVVHLQGESSEELAFTYWNSKRLNNSSALQDDLLVIMRRLDGSFYLEIGNIYHEGELSDLEIILYNWALGEGFFD
jgi:hypothetical protein